MFATLGMPEQPATVRRLRRRAAKPALTCSRVTLPNYFSFYHIQVTRCDADDLPWDAIAETAGAFRSRLLLPQCMTLPETAAVGAFAPRRLPLRFLCNSALLTLQTLRPDPLTQRLCVVDPYGELEDRIEAFAPFVSQLRVVTDDLLAYGDAAARLRDRCGLSLLVTPDDSETMTQSNLLLLDDAADAPLAFAGLIFCNHPQTRMNATVFTPGAVTLPPAFAALCPPGIDPLQFAAAAYELCAADELGEISAACRQNEG